MTVRTTLSEAPPGISASISRVTRTKDLKDVRHYPLDLIGATRETVGPDARARMIRLQARPAMEALPVRDLSSLIMEPVTLVAVPGIKTVVLTQDATLAESLDSAAGLIDRIESDGVYQDGGWRILRRGTVAYQRGCIVYDCLAIRLVHSNSTQPK